MRREGRTLGQVMVLGVVTMLILAFSLMLSFNVTQAIHEKIRLQQHSDAMAYSMATVEARTFNYIAYTNRTIASAYVSMATAHAYMSAAGLTVNILQAGRMNFLFIALEEFAQGCCCPYPCTCGQHCQHASDAFQIMRDYGDAADDYGDKIKDHEQDFNDAIKDLADMIDGLHKQQQDAVQSASRYLRGEGLDKLKSYNAPHASDLAQGAAGFNVQELACALEGVDLDCNDTTKSDPEARSKVMTSVANAARPDFPRDRMTGVPLMLSYQFHPNKLLDLQDNDGMAWAMTSGGGCARVSASPTDCSPSGAGDEGKAVAAKDEGGILFNQWKDGAMVWPFSASNIGSDDQSGDHNPSAAHEDEHGEFKGIQPEDVCSEGMCFVNFRSTDDEGKNFGQPRVLGAFTQDLRILPKGVRGPWEISQSGSVTMNDGDRGDARLMLAPDREGYALSKALVYFHRFDNWQMPPNLFDPYWRAKLHPFNDTDEMKNALSAAGFPDDEALSGDAPVEGQRASQR